MQYIGMRTLKTGLTVLLAALAAQMINPDDQFVLLFTALIALENTVASSFENGMKRIAATIIGAISAILLVYTGLPLPIAAGLAVMLLIIAANRLEQTGSIGMSASVTILILLNGYAGQNPYFFTLIRLRDTFIAVMLAVLVNLIIFPPRASRRIRERSRSLYDYTLALIEKIYLYGIGDNLNEYRDKIQELVKDIQLAEEELGIVKSVEDQRLAIFKKLIPEYQKIYIYAENLSLMGSDLRVTQANQDQLTEYFSHEEMLDPPWDEDVMTKEEVIYNYTLQRLITSLETVRVLEQTLISQESAA